MNELLWQLVGGEGPAGRPYKQSELPAGATAVLYEPEPEPTEAERRELEQRRQRAELEAQQRVYDRSPQGRREAALRSAAESGGSSRVTVVGGDDSDTFQTSRESDPLCGKWL